MRTCIRLQIFRIQVTEKLRTILEHRVIFLKATMYLHPYTSYYLTTTGTAAFCWWEERHGHES